MKVKTSELTGKALNWAVSCCEGADPFSDGMSWIVDIKGGYFQIPDYSGAWDKGGPIIGKERISLRHDYWENGGCRAFIDRGGSLRNIVGSMHGPTPLIAAMRCYVASKLGDEVEIPEALA